MKEKITVRGDVTITIHDLVNGTQEIRELKNLVMRVGKTVLAKRLAGDVAYTNSAISRISFGTSDIAATDLQTDLQGTVVTPAAAIAVSYPAYNSVMFSSTMLGTEGGVNTYQEIGLFTADNKMFSRLVISPITKSAQYAISVGWTISFQ